MTEGGNGDDSSNRRRWSRYVSIQFGDGADTIQDTQCKAIAWFWCRNSASNRQSWTWRQAILWCFAGNGEDPIQITGLGVSSPADFHTVRQSEFVDGTVFTDGELLVRGFQLSLSGNWRNAARNVVLPTTTQGSQTEDWLHGRGGKRRVARWIG